jgi:TRAP-type C4-dicarboxylate transport system substrate-binding protein
LVLALVTGLIAVAAVNCGSVEETTTTVPPAATTTIPDTGQNYEFTFSHAMSPMASLYSTYLVPWTKAVQQGSNGRVTIKEYADSALYEEALRFPNP